jgi:hypothetical protein
MREYSHPAAGRWSATRRGRWEAPQSDPPEPQGGAARAAGAFFGNQPTRRLAQACLRRRISAEGDCCGPWQRMVSVPRLVGFALVRSSPTPDFRSHDGATLASGDESTMNQHPAYLSTTTCRPYSRGVCGPRHHPRGSQMRSMHDAASELRRIPLPRTPVNKGKRKGRSVDYLRLTRKNLEQ